MLLIFVVRFAILYSYQIVLVQVWVHFADFVLFERFYGTTGRDGIPGKRQKLVPGQTFGKEREIAVTTIRPAPTGAVALCYVKFVVDTLSKLRVTLVISFKVREMCRSRSQCFDCYAEVE